MHRRIVLIMLMLALAACGDNQAATASPTRAAPVAPSPATTAEPTSVTGLYSQTVQHLTIIEGKQDDAATLRTISQLIASLDQKFPETEIHIGNVTARAYAFLKEDGLPASIITIMTEMDKIDAPPGLSYKDSVTAWMITQGATP